MTDVVTGSLQVDHKRRTTLPGDILAAAGIPAGSPLVARVEEPGRIVLESPALLLALLQDDIAAALARPSHSTADGDGNWADSAEDPPEDRPENQPESQPESNPGPTRDLVAELLADRAADSSLTTSHNHQHNHQHDPQQDRQHDHQAEVEPEPLGHESTHKSSDGSDTSAAPNTPASDLPHPHDGAA